MSEVESHQPQCPRCGKSNVVPTSNIWVCKDCFQLFAVNDAGQSHAVAEIPLGPQVAGAPERCKALADNPLWCKQVIEQWPGPIAHEYGRLRERLAAGDVVGAVWQLKDVAEIIARFPACVMYRDVLDNGKDDEFTRKSRNKMLGPAMSMGSWVEFADELSVHLQKNSSNLAKQETIPLPKDSKESDAVKPALFEHPQIAGMFRKPNGKQTSLKAHITELVTWRNKNIGHGAFRLDVSDFLQDMEEHLPKLHHALKEVADVWGDLELCSEDGKTLTGADSIRNQHDASMDVHAGSRLPLFLAKRGSADLFPLFPIIQLRRCSACQAQDVFLFDSRRIFSDKPGQDRYSFIDYLAGHGQESHWYAEPELHADIRQLERTDVAAIGDEAHLESETLSYGIVDLLDESSMAAQYQSPTYLRNALGEFLEQCHTEKKGGLWWLQAPGHVGKSTFVTGIDPRHSDLKEDPLATDLRVISFYIRREYQIWPGQFVDELNSQLRDALQIKSGKETLPTLKVDDAQPAEALVAWLVAMRARAAATGNQDRVLICIDGLDELVVDSVKNERSIIDFLPAPNTVPEGIYFVLTSRPLADIPAGVVARLGDRLDGAQIYEVTTQLPAYQELMRTYFTGRLKVRNAARAKSGDQKINLEPLFKDVLTQSDGRFLYLSYITELLADETLPMDQVGQLPPADQLFGHFLNELQRLHDGKTPIGQLFKRILIHLAAAEEAYEKDKDSLPVVARELWQGLPLEILNKRVEGKGNGELTVKLAYALYTLKPILGSWKGGDERHARYKLGLKGLVEIVRGRWPEKLKAAHEQLAEELLKRAEGMADTDGANDIAGLDADEQWRLRYFGAHLLLCEPQFQRNVAHRKSAIEPILSWIQSIYKKFDYQIDSQNAIRHIQSGILLPELSLKLLGKESPSYLVWNLARAYGDRGVTLGSFCDQKASLTDHDRAIELWKMLRNQLGERWDPVDDNSFANAYMARGAAKRDLSDTEGALADFEQAIQEREKLREKLGEEWTSDLANDLASAHVNQGNVWNDNNRFDEALAEYGQGIKLLEMLCEQPGKEWSADWCVNLAHAYGNKGCALHGKNKLDDALVAHTHAIELWEMIRKQLGEKWWLGNDRDVAQAYSHRGNVLRAKGDRGAAIGDYERAISLQNELRKQLGHKLPAQWTIDLAAIYYNRGIAHYDRDELAKALSDCRSAIDLWEELKTQPGVKFLPFWSNSLARAYMACGVILRDKSDYVAALVDCGRAIELQEVLREQIGFDQQWQSVLRNDLAKSYDNRGKAFQANGDLGDALIDFTSAIDTWTKLCEDVGWDWQPNWVIDLATTFRNRGDVLCDSEKHAEAVIAYESSIKLTENLLKEYGDHIQPMMVNTLAVCYMNRGLALINSGDRNAACSSFGHAIELWENLRTQLGNQWQASMEHNLSSAYVLRSEASRDSGAPVRAQAGVARTNVSIEKIHAQPVQQWSTALSMTWRWPT